MSNPAAAIAYAQAQLGKPYSMGAAGPDKFDCSGLTLRAWQAAGAPALPHFTVAQYAATSHKPIGQASPGDLVFWNDGGWIHHVALYIGAGKIIEAADYGIPVRVRSITATETGIMPNVGVMPNPQTSAVADVKFSPNGGAIAGGILGGLTGGLGGAFGDLYGGGTSGLPSPGDVAGGVASAATSATVKAVLPFVLKLAFIGGGITLAVLGLIKAAEPAASKAMQALPTPPEI